MWVSLADLPGRAWLLAGSPFHQLFTGVRQKKTTLKRRKKPSLNATAVSVKATTILTTSTSLSLVLCLRVWKGKSGMKKGVFSCCTCAHNNKNGPHLLEQEIAYTGTRKGVTWGRFIFIFILLQYLSRFLLPQIITADRFREKPELLREACDGIRTGIFFFLMFLYFALNDK